ncbi:hypothetical protein [Bradyrhizobium sp.]|uniref:hypothetical protein n=1 Tax=Bradyrhizobium sp. TaxID=376 RepID=UPI003C4F966E
MRNSDYYEGLEEGYSAGKHDGIVVTRRRQHRYAWFKLFGVIVFGCFAAHFVWALIATLT